MLFWGCVGRRVILRGACALIISLLQLSDLVRAMRTGIAAEMKPKYGDNAPAFKGSFIWLIFFIQALSGSLHRSHPSMIMSGSQVLSFLSSRGVKQPDERMFVSRELLSRGFIAHVVAGSKQPNVLDFHDGNRYRFTQKVCIALFDTLYYLIV